MNFSDEVLTISSTKNPEQKREKKKKLIEAVVQWCYTNENEAREAFKTSAKEIVEKLIKIESILNSNRVMTKTQ